MEILCCKSKLHFYATHYLHSEIHIYWLKTSQGNNRHMAITTQHAHAWSTMTSEDDYDVRAGKITNTSLEDASLTARSFFSGVCPHGRRQSSLALVRAILLKNRTPLQRYSLDCILIIVTVGAGGRILNLYCCDYTTKEQLVLSMMFLLQAHISSWRNSDYSDY